MKLRSLGLVALLLATAAAHVSAQSAIWKWRDKDGRMQISDRAPPPEVPERDILQRPSGARAAAPVAEDGAAIDPASGASVPTTDPQLEARKRKLAQEQAAQVAQKQNASNAEKERVQAMRAESCRRAQAQLKMLESGARMARPNAQGEREIMDDQARAQETQRTQQLIQGNCGAG